MFQVPDRIAVTDQEGDAQALMDHYNVGRSAVDMNVPDRIVVAGTGTCLSIELYLGD